MKALLVRDPTDVAGARREAAVLSTQIGYDQTRAGQVAIVVSELAQNLLRHAGGGEVLVRPDPQHPGGIEILAIDRGPGMADVAACMRDGFSTIGTSGNGLGAVKRMARELLIQSVKGSGTVLLARMTRHEEHGEPKERTTATLCVPKQGETICGDSASIVRRPDGSVGFLLADGLGHGPMAAAASQEAVRLFETHTDTSPAVVLATLHAGLRPTRGAAVAAASIDPDARRVAYGGIGNIAGFITDTGGVRRMVSHSGTAGHTAGRTQEFYYPIYNRPVLVMFSDGLTTSWSPESHPGLFALDPLLIAAVLYRDHTRGRDDASVIVWKG